jgi:hypothetical protein
MVLPWCHLPPNFFWGLTGMAGLGLSGQKNAARRDHAHRYRLQNLYEPQKKWALESPAGES